MFVTPPAVAHMLRAERHRELVARAAAHRLRRQMKASQRVGRTNGRRRRWIDELVHRIRDHDQRIVRLGQSWLAPDRTSAKLLAQAADEVDLPAGTVLESGRFSYVGLDAAHVGLVVSDGTSSVKLDSDATLLVVATRDIEELSRVSPMLSDAMSRARARPHDGELHRSMCLGMLDRPRRVSHSAASWKHIPLPHRPTVDTPDTDSGSRRHDFGVDRLRTSSPDEEHRVA